MPCATARWIGPLVMSALHRVYADVCSPAVWPFVPEPNAINECPKLRIVLEEPLGWPFECSPFLRRFRRWQRLDEGVEAWGHSHDDKRWG